MRWALRPLELSPPRVVRGETSSTAGEPTAVTLEGVVFELLVRNKSLDYSLYVSLDYGDTYDEVPPDSQARYLLGAMADPLILLKSDGASQPYELVYRVRLA